MHLAGGYAAVKAVQHAALLEQGQHVLRDVAEIVHAVAMVLQAAHQLLHPAARAQDVQPVVQHALHLKLAPGGLGVAQHGLIAVKAGDKPGIQLLPLLAAKGQVIHLLLDLFIANAVYQIGAGGKIHHDTAQMKHDAFIHLKFPLFLMECSAHSIPQSAMRFPLLFA